MAITKISVSVGRTVNIGNYESIRAEIMLEDSIDSVRPLKDEDVTNLRKVLNVQACKELDATITNMGNLYRS